MGRLNIKTIRHNKEISKISENAIVREIRERNKAAQKEAKLSSLEYKTEVEQRKCIQAIYPFEKEWKKESEAKVPNLEKIENSRIALLRALDKGAADSMGRILAEIKQVCLDSKELLTENVDIDVFYEGFKKFLENNFVNYFVTEEEMNKILKPYIDQNLLRIKQLGERFDYTKPAEKLIENIEVVKKVAIKEKVLSL